MNEIRICPESTRLYSALSALQQFLNVCVRNIHNCGTCFKCARTMFQLELIGKLDVFSSVFDVSSYYNHRKKILKLLSKDFHFHEEFLVEAEKGKSPFSPLKLKIVFVGRRAFQAFTNGRKWIKRKLKFRHRV